MTIIIRQYEPQDAVAAVEIWNQVIEDGIAFPQTQGLTLDGGNEFFLAQDYTGVACDRDSGEVLGLYILHPNNVGRCGHIANTSYAVRRDVRGLHIGKQLVLDSLVKGKECGFHVMQFNAVVRSNIGALHLYESVGFVRLGIVPEGFLMKDGHYEDIVLMYKELK